MSTSGRSSEAISGGRSGAVNSAAAPSPPYLSPPVPSRDSVGCFARHFRLHKRNEEPFARAIIVANHLPESVLEAIFVQDYLQRNCGVRM